MCADTQIQAVREAYDRLAPDYETEFTGSLLAGLQRRAIWRLLRGKFRPGQRVLDLGCGTGEDAVRLARRGIAVHGIDLSEGMLEIGRYKIASAGLEGLVTLEQRSIEDLGSLDTRPFDGAVSIFAAFNCLLDVRSAAAQLGRLVKPGACVAVCLMNRTSLWDMLLRPLTTLLGRASSERDPHEFTLHYRGVRETAAAFDRWFTLEGAPGIGIVLPPADLEALAQRAPKLMRVLAGVDRALGNLPWIRDWADHRLLIFRRRVAH